ncbi:iron chaperone [Streptomyces sp. BA2]|uniref:iron chaperone n=1 Tax=Streptomyces sp. BA2 TaxID=436595 RepID=UPI003FA6C22A
MGQPRPCRLVRGGGLRHAARVVAREAQVTVRVGQLVRVAAVVAKIAEMQESDRVMAERIHAVIKESVPELSPKLWYGMPSYAKDGKVVCFFQSAQKFSARYATFGFSDKANLDDGAMWPASYALTELTSEGEARIAALVRNAVS